MKFTKTAQYHDATNDRRYLIFHGISHEIYQSSSVPWCYKWQALSNFFMVFPVKFTKTAQYHDATNDTPYLIVHGISKKNHQSSSIPQCYKWQALSHLFMVFPNEIHQNSSGPWCHKWQALSHFFMVFPNEIDQNSLIPWCYKSHALSHFFMVFPMKFTKAAQYHDATNDTRYLIFSWYLPWNSPKQLSTMMPKMTCVTQNSSVPSSP